MTSLTIYAVLVLLIIGASLMVVYNFVRYRFTGDLTLTYIFIYSFLFICYVGLTLSLIPASNQ